MQDDSCVLVDAGSEMEGGGSVDTRRDIEGGGSEIEGGGSADGGSEIEGGRQSGSDVKRRKHIN